MARRISWTNNSSGYSGTYVYRAPRPLDTQNLPAPVVTVDPVVQGATAEWIDGEELAAGDYDYAVQDFDGQGVGALSSVTAYTVPEDLSTAQIGDYIAGGVYAGIDTIDGADYYIISGDAASEASGLQSKTSATSTAGADSDADGLANTQAMIDAGITDHPAAEHCINYAGGGYSDWHMPARNQITLLYNNLAGHAEFADNVNSGTSTWSSSDSSSTSAWERRFYDGIEFSTSKDATYLRVRPIRRVAV